MKKEIPILFSTEMVKALVDDRKTMTRRIIKSEINDCYFQSLVHHHTGRFTFVENGNFNPKEEDVIHVKCPYGQPGDLLWVRENWQLTGWSFEDGLMNIKYEADGAILNCEMHDPNEDCMWLANKVEKLLKYGYFQPSHDNPKTEEEELLIRTDKPLPFYPSIHMPKEAARIWLEVTDVRVERLNDITEQDAIAEGILIRNRAVKPYDLIYQVSGNPTLFPTAKSAFNWLWQSINGQESWDANPWVWVVSFKVVSKTGKP